MFRKVLSLQKSFQALFVAVEDQRKILLRKGEVSGRDEILALPCNIRILSEFLVNFYLRYVLQSLRIRSCYPTPSFKSSIYIVNLRVLRSNLV